MTFTYVSYLLVPFLGEYNLSPSFDLSLTLGNVVPCLLSHSRQYTYITTHMAERYWSEEGFLLITGHRSRIEIHM